MAIFSLNHSFIGRTTHPSGAASLYASYITRADACTETLGERMPVERGPLIQWLDAQEAGDRKNARVIDRLIVALPVELSHEQNVELLREFGERMTEGRASWMAAIHDGPRDADNPHAHIIVRDRDVETGRRVMMTTEPGSTQRFRDGWEQEVNIALERAGLDIRVDCHSLEAQGLDREAQIHVGAGATALAQRGYEFESNEREITRIIDGTATTLTVNYPRIDEGRSRFEENEDRKARNAEREASQYDPADPDLHWTRRGGMVAQQHAAMDWVQKAADRADALWIRALTGNPPMDDDTDTTAALVREHLSDRRMERLSLQQARGQSDRTAEAWESRMSEFARAQMDATEISLDRGMGMER